MLLYADDALLYVAKADISIPTTLTLEEHFGYRASYAFISAALPDLLLSLLYKTEVCFMARNGKTVPQVQKLSAFLVTVNSERL